MLLASCDGEDAGVRVCAAASLSEALPEVLRAVGAENTTVTFGASSALARQIRLGAPCDLFISADASWPETLSSEDLTRGNAVSLATNTLVVAVPHGAPVPTSLASLMEASYARIAVAAEEVPLGRATHHALAQAHLLESLSPRFVIGADANATRAWVARGEAQAGFVYATDVTQAPALAHAFDVPASLYEPLVVTTIVLRGAHANTETVRDALTSEQARRVLRAHGFRVDASVE